MVQSYIIIPPYGKLFPLFFEGKVKWAEMDYAASWENYTFAAKLGT